MKCCKILQSELSTEDAFTFHYKTTCETETLMREWDNWGKNKQSQKNNMLILNI